MKLNTARLVAVSAALGTSAVASAATTPPVMTELTGAVDFSTVGPAILAVGALGIAIKLAWVAVKYVRKLAGGA